MSSDYNPYPARNNKGRLKFYDSDGLSAFTADKVCLKRLCRPLYRYGQAHTAADA
ncbi:hypothetical protein [Neisseria montereyensis]|uniref:Uncharacterized protein n=1 Tax=Neisseria montereyensis TaxID=2973938 RepID=A0ABT2FDG1_9NEIS|nr:hypothetical protein [Neisseria montereyensis]MCS4533553.1 hypothetical protein [Neisseria montereyensis]